MRSRGMPDWLYLLIACGPPLALGVFLILSVVAAALVGFAAYLVLRGC